MDSKGIGDGLKDEPGLAYGGKGHEHHAVRKGVLDLVSRRDCQPGLPDASGPSQSEETNAAGEQGGCRSDVLLSADERRQRSGKFRGEGNCSNAEHSSRLGASQNRQCRILLTNHSAVNRLVTGPFRHPRTSVVDAESASHDTGSVAGSPSDPLSCTCLWRGTTPACAGTDRGCEAKPMPGDSRSST